MRFATILHIRRYAVMTCRFPVPDVVCLTTILEQLTELLHTRMDKQHRSCFTTGDLNTTEKYAGLDGIKGREKTKDPRKRCLWAVTVLKERPTAT